MAKNLVFIHGLESSAQGNKGKYFRENFPQMLIENYTGDFKTRMKKLELVLRGKDQLIIVGSSYGGLMAARFALDEEIRIKKLILLAPALTIEGFESTVWQKLALPVIIYHGIKDDVVNPHEVKRIAEKTFSRLEHHLVDDDHPLSGTFASLSWRVLLEQE